MKKNGKLKKLGLYIWFIGVILFLVMIFSNNDSIFIKYGHIAMYIGIIIWVIGAIGKKNN